MGGCGCKFVCVFACARARGARMQHEYAEEEDTCMSHSCNMSTHFPSLQSCIPASLYSPKNPPPQKTYLSGRGIFWGGGFLSQRHSVSCPVVVNYVSLSPILRSLAALPIPSPSHQTARTLFRYRSCKCSSSRFTQQVRRRIHACHSRTENNALDLRCL